MAKIDEDAATQRERMPAVVKPQVALTAAQAIAQMGEETVTMFFPKEVHLTRDDHARITFQAGVQEVPRSLAAHWWLRQHGVKATGGRREGFGFVGGDVAAAEKAARERAALDAERVRAENEVVAQQQGEAEAEQRRQDEARRRAQESERQTAEAAKKRR